MRCVPLQRHLWSPLGDNEVARAVQELDLRGSQDLSEEFTVCGTQLPINRDLRAERRVNASGIKRVRSF